MPKRILLLVASCVLVASLAVSALAAPIVDRGVQVTVFPDRVDVRYEFALTPESARAMTTPGELGADAVGADAVGADTFSGESEDGREDDRYALMEAFRESAESEIAGRLRLSVDGQPLKLQSTGATLFPKHFVQLALGYEASFPPDIVAGKLSVSDGCFRGVAGEHQIAIRGKGGAQIGASTVPLILVRAGRHPAFDASAQATEATRRAEATFSLTGSAQPTGATPTSETRDSMQAGDPGNAAEPEQDQAHSLVDPNHEPQTPPAAAPGDGHGLPIRGLAITAAITFVIMVGLAGFWLRARRWP